MRGQADKPTALRSTFERSARRKGYRLIAGADEAGRGSLFGPVFAAAVILDPLRPIRGLRDSKQLTPERRRLLACRIRERAVAWAVATADASEIDRINIYQASRLAIARALAMLQPPPDFAFIDALEVDLPIPQRGLVRGDSRCPSIAAASILAKVERDACMCDWALRYPQYGLASNKGYPTLDHIQALALYGPTPHHRMTFEPVRQMRLFVTQEAAGCR